MQFVSYQRQESKNKHTQIENLYLFLRSVVRDTFHYIIQKKKKIDLCRKIRNNNASKSNTHFDVIKIIRAIVVQYLTYLVLD